MWWISYKKYNNIHLFPEESRLVISTAQLAGTIEYTDCNSAEW